MLIDQRFIEEINSGLQVNSSILQNFVKCRQKFVKMHQNFVKKNVKDKTGISLELELEIVN